MSKNRKPEIVFTPYTPYLVSGLKKFTNSRGDSIRTEPVMSLCRCGGSDYKPFCDGTHSKNKFVGEKKDDREPNNIREYIGRSITVVDDRGFCAHDGACTDNSPKVFNIENSPWIAADGESANDLIKTIEKCPSGALSYKVSGVHHDSLSRDPEIIVTANGPLHIVGGIELLDESEDKPLSTEHYALCRCGGSSNKPFCDGEHWDNGFEDEEN